MLEIEGKEMTDQELLAKAEENARLEYDKRNAEFCAKIGITPEQYQAVVKHMPTVKDRPFFNTPLAVDAFVLGYVVSHEKHRKQK